MTFDAARLMISSGIVSEEAVRRAREAQSARGGSLPRVCYEQGLLDEARWSRVVAKALSLPTLDLDSLEVDPAAQGKAPAMLLRELAVFPFQIKDQGRVLGVAMAEPQDEVAQAQLRAATGCELEIGVAGYGAIERALARADAPPDQAAGMQERAGEGPGEIEGFEPGQVSRSGDSKPPLLDGDGAIAGGDTEGLMADLIGRVEALSEAAARSASALRAAVDLCVERRLFTPDDLRGRLNKKPRA